jgi:hypothetical protein
MLAAKAVAVLQQENRLIGMLRSTAEKRVPIMVAVTDPLCLSVVGRLQPACGGNGGPANDLLDLMAASLDAQAHAYRTDALPAEDALAVAAEAAGLRIARVLKNLEVRMSGYAMATQGIRALLKDPRHISPASLDDGAAFRARLVTQHVIQDLLIDNAVDLEDMLNGGTEAKYAESIRRRERLMARVRAMPATTVTSRLLTLLTHENLLVQVLQRNLARGARNGAAVSDAAQLAPCMMAPRPSPTCGDVKARMDDVIAATFEGMQDLVDVYRQKALPAEDALAAVVPALVFDRVLGAYGVSIAGFERALDVNKRLPVSRPPAALMPPP